MGNKMDVDATLKRKILFPPEIYPLQFSPCTKILLTMPLTLYSLKLNNNNYKSMHPVCVCVCVCVRARIYAGWN